MTTLIAVYNSDGCVGRCDARCYNAAEEPCDCICGGRNHGAGIEQATGNTRELAESWIEQARASGQDITRAELAVPAACEPLFSLADIRGSRQRARSPPNPRSAVADRKATSTARKAP